MNFKTYINKLLVMPIQFISIVDRNCIDNSNLHYMEYQSLRIYNALWQIYK